MKISEVDFQPLKLSVGGGMAIQQSVATRWHELTGCKRHWKVME